LVRNLTTPCLGHEPKVRVATSTFHDVSVSRCDVYCTKQRNSGCFLHIHLQPKLVGNNRGTRAEPNNLQPSRFGCPYISDEGESTFYRSGKNWMVSQSYWEHLDKGIPKTTPTSHPSTPYLSSRTQSYHNQRHKLLGVGGASSSRECTSL
jgi:hypothetical protein